MAAHHNISADQGGVVMAHNVSDVIAAGKALVAAVKEYEAARGAPLLGDGMGINASGYTITLTKGESWGDTT